GGRGGGGGGWGRGGPAGRAGAPGTGPTRRPEAVADETARLRGEAASRGGVVPLRRCRPASSRLRHIIGVLLDTVLTDSGVEDARKRPRSACRSALARRSPLALEAGGEPFPGRAGRSLAHRSGDPERP